MAAVSIYVKMSNVMLALSVFLLSARYWLYEFFYYGENVYINYEAVGILLPMALCCLSTSFICLYSASYLVNRWFTKFLKILAVVGCFIGGFQEFAGVVVWRIAFAIPTNWKHQITGDHDKPLELAVDYVFPPTALMVSSILALIVAVLLTIDVCTMSETTVGVPASDGRGNPIPATNTAPALNDNCLLVLNQERLLVALPRMMMAACIVFLTITFGLYDWDYYINGSVSTGFKHEAVGVLMSLALCILVTAFLFLCWWSFLPVRKPTCVDIFLNIAAVIGGFIGGILVFVGVVLWRLTVEVYFAPTHKIDIPGKVKPPELRLHYSFPPTSLMISVILAVSSAIMILVHTCTRKTTTDPVNVEYRAASGEAVLVQQPGVQNQSSGHIMMQPQQGVILNQQPTLLSHQSPPQTYVLQYM